MQQQSPMAAAVGVELRTSTVTVSIRRGDEEPELRRFDGGTGLDEVLGRLRDARDEVAAGPAPVVFAVPASWERARRAELVDAAERAGFDRAKAVPAPEAAAVYFAEDLERELEPGAALAVCRLGASSCEVAVVRRTDLGYTVEAAASTDEVGGDEFDQLLLAYLSGRYRDTDPAFWDRLDEPGEGDEATPRTRLLAEIRRARELISKRPKAGVPLPGADRDLHLTRDEVEGCIGELVDQCVGLVSAVLDEAGVEASGLLLTGGASRTPLLLARLRRRTGLVPVLPDRPEAAVAEGARLAAHAEAAPVGAEAERRGATPRRLAVLAAVVLPLVAATAVFGSELGTGEGPGPEAADQTSEVEEAPSSEDASSPEVEPGAGGADRDEPHAASQSPTEDEPSEADSPEPPTNGGGGGGGDDDREESATSGTVPTVTEMSAHDAERALNDAGFTEVAFENEREGLFGPWYDECEVIEQDPAPGRSHAYGETVTITYSYRSTEPSECEA